MSTTMSYKTAEAAAHAVFDAAELPSASARPLSPYDPSKTMWWLMPTKEYPAYHRGKIAFEPTWPGIDGMFIGLLVEKGFDASIRELAKTSREARGFMDEEWEDFWKAFLDDLVTERIASACEALECTVEHPVLVRVFGFAWNESESEPYEGDSEVISFECTGKKLRRMEELCSPASGLLAGIDKATTFPELAKAIEGIPNPQWTWICVYIGHVFEAISSVDTPGVWTGEKIWREYLRPLVRWFR